MRAVYLVLFAVVPGFFWGCSGNNNLPSGSGFIEATETVVSAEATGRITAMHVGEGDYVEKGRVLAELDTVTTSLRLKQAGATKRAAEKRIKIALINIDQAKQNLTLAKKEYDRAQSLIKSGSVNKQLYDRAGTAYQQALLSLKQSEAAYESAQADLDKINSDIGLLEQQFDDCFPKSPQSGIIVSKYLEAGEWAAVGRPIVKIAALDTVWVKIYLPPGNLTGIHLGGRAEIDPEDGRETPIEGTISWISNEAEFTPKNVQTKEARADLVYAVKIIIPNGDAALKIGMPVSVTIP